MKEDNFIKHLKKHNPKAMDYVFDTYGNLIFKVSYSVLNNRNLSEECVNDVLMKIWNNIDSFHGGNDKFKSWVIVIARYCAIDILRREEKHNENISFELNHETKDDGFEKMIEDKESRRELLDEILTFDDENKEIFIKRFFLHYSVKEISRIMNLSENAISTRILRGRKKLINNLKGRIF